MPRKAKEIKKVEDDVFKASQSKTKTWLKCKRAYHYKYVEKLKRVKIGRPLQFGRIIHEMIEVYGNGGDPFAKLEEIEIDQAKTFKAEQDMYGELVADIGYIMEDYFSYWSGKDKNAFKYVKVNGKHTEHSFAVPIEPGLIITGKIDALVKTPDKMNWLAEHKSFNRRPSEEFRWVNIQSSVYLRVAEMLGFPALDGTMWDYVHSKAPAMPQELKGGNISQKKIYTLPTAVKQFCSDNKLKWKDYPSLMAHATECRKEYFFRIRNPVASKVVDAIYSDFIDAVKDMRDNHGKKKMRTIEQHCQWCDYSPLCKAEMLGHDTKFIMKREYVYDEKTHEDAVQELVEAE